MMNTKHSNQTGLVALCFFSFAAFSAVANAGSINNSSSDSTIINCDVRRSHLDMSWCTQEVADRLYNSCYAVIHMNFESLGKCDWQGCGPLSLVGQKAKISGDNVVEYGVSTPHAGAATPPTTWRYVPLTKEVLPKSPYRRHYLTISEFAAERQKCGQPGADSDPVTSKICMVNSNAFDMNVYFYCMKKRGKSLGP